MDGFDICGPDDPMPQIALRRVELSRVELSRIAHVRRRSAQRPLGVAKS